MRAWLRSAASSGLPAELSVGKLGEEQALYCNGRLRCTAIPTITTDGRLYNIHRFATAAGASAYMVKFGGEWFDPGDR